MIKKITYILSKILHIILSFFSSFIPSPLSFNVKRTIDCNLEQYIEAYLAIFMPQAYAKKFQAIDYKESSRLKIYCHRLNLSLDTKLPVSPKRLEKAANFSIAKHQYQKKISSLIHLNDNGHLLPYMYWVTNKFDSPNNTPFLFNEGEELTVFPGQTKYSPDKHLYTFSVYTCQVVIIHIHGKGFLFSHLKIGHLYTKRAQKGISALKSKYRDCIDNEVNTVSAYMLGDDPSPLANYINQQLSELHPLSNIYIYQKSPHLCMSVKSEMKKNEMNITIEMHSAELLRQPGWNYPNAAFPQSPMVLKPDFKTLQLSK
ncbi:hypothetical protein [Kiloniella sp. EL199]|uniref:hypothetical protein n=1 Tax=Kiloniella sp. EL199 TaxID=2107581 RepID=UPI000EA0445E|nr:hypothetical protein [Kiloniella sp. EL199]